MKKLLLFIFFAITSLTSYSQIGISVDSVVTLSIQDSSLAALHFDLGERTYLRAYYKNSDDCKPFSTFYEISEDTVTSITYNFYRRCKEFVEERILNYNENIILEYDQYCDQSQVSYKIYKNGRQKNIYILPSSQ